MSRYGDYEDGIKARSKRGAFATSWWAQRWIAALEQLVDSGRLSRGRSYARGGRVLSIEETRNGVTARVQGSRPSPYKININITPLSDAEWEKVLDALAEQAIFTAQLLAGEMPRDIETAFAAARVSLFPSRRAELITACSCPDYANPCKHVAATHYILGERFDEDPFLIFRLRGRTQEQIMDGLRQRRAGEAAAVEAEPEENEIAPALESQMDGFWDFAAPLEDFSVSIQPPVVAMPLFKRLGEASFCPDPGLEALLRKPCEAISQRAVDAAYQEKGEVDDELPEVD
ncbi:MAG TPA: SWIM zinc finger family protein [Anaerolineaceae bacterium]|nr:SWIM zinc finger family protein [Anaerolineaceae bacterium]HPN54233.1 SWIM zinc finger family protein [Anaerolineaceae bacterium]